MRNEEQDLIHSLGDNSGPGLESVRRRCKSWAPLRSGQLVGTEEVGCCQVSQEDMRGVQGVREEGGEGRREKGDWLSQLGGGCHPRDGDTFDKDMHTWEVDSSFDTYLKLMLGDIYVHVEFRLDVLLVFDSV